MIIFSWLFSYQLRFNFLIPAEHLFIIQNSVIYVVSIQFLVFYVFQIYRASWRFSSLNELKKIIYAAFVSSVLIYVYFFYFYSPIPKSITILNSILLIFLISAPRFFYRSIWELSQQNKKLNQYRYILILGSSDKLFYSLKSFIEDSKNSFIGIVTSNSSFIGRNFFGLEVLGDLNDLPKINRHYPFQRAIIVMPDDDYEIKKNLIKKLNDLNIKIYNFPTYSQMFENNQNLKFIREFHIEDLLGREEVNLDSSSILSEVKNKVVFVSGAGGSIGSEICNQIMQYQPKALLAYDISEFSLYKLKQNFIKKGLKNNIKYFLGNIQNTKSLSKLFKDHNPNIIFHAAAYKHVPMIENDNNIEALTNNALGTYILANEAKKYKVNKFILISTDKAINPTNVMGASKRLAEIICLKIQSKCKTKFITVRFGNVLNSSGSVIPLFTEQIQNGGPITITDKRITRYFMSIPEAAKLVLQSTIIGNGGEVFILDMGKPIKIINLAKDMINLSGYNEDMIKIKTIGLRPGEKLFEELIGYSENSFDTNHSKIRSVLSKTTTSFSLKDLINWLKYIQVNDVNIKKEIVKFVPEYKEQK